jgi:hypothetical protein
MREVNMKKIILFLFSLTLCVNAQEFKVEKISGTVKLLKGTSEVWENIKVGQILSSEDLILTESNSLIQLSKEGERFLLKEDAAIGLNHVKEVSINDLVLALALDEIRNVPKTKRNGLSKNTAVYGSEVISSKNISISDEELGQKKLNGAKLLNESGFTESSIIAAKEVFRNYPSIAKNFNNRIYFADLLNELSLHQEAVSEYGRIENLNLTEQQLATVKKKNEEVSLKIMEK